MDRPVSQSWECCSFEIYIRCKNESRETVIAPLLEVSLLMFPVYMKDNRFLQKVLSRDSREFSPHLNQSPVLMFWKRTGLLNYFTFSVCCFCMCFLQMLLESIVVVSTMTITAILNAYLSTHFSFQKSIIARRSSVGAHKPT